MPLQHLSTPTAVPALYCPPARHCSVLSSGAWRHDREGVVDAHLAARHCMAVSHICTITFKRLPAALH